MKEQRLEKRIERLEKENDSLRAEIKKYKENEKNWRQKELEWLDKEKLVDETIAEYHEMLLELRDTRDQYQAILAKLRQYDSKMVKKYNKAVTEVVKAIN